MIRLVGLYLFLFALPFVLYAAYVYLTRRTLPEGGVYAGAPWMSLAATGVVLAIVSFLAIAVFSGGDPDSVYVPARLEDGKIVPGRLVPRESVEPAPQ